MARVPVIGGNWKMHLDLTEAVALATDVRNRLGSTRGAEVILFPPFPFLKTIADRVEGSAIQVGGQDLHFEKSGAFTGAVTATMLKSVGCSHVLVGHSERRSVFGDTDAVVGRKLLAALDAGLKPVLCIGELLEERKSNQTFQVVARQLQSAIASIPVGRLADLVLAYEPVWAIGTGLTASPEQAQEVHAYIRQKLADLHGASFATATRIQYGGSVKGSNAAGLFTQPDIDGMLVGGASLKGEEFAQIVKARA
ncbi:MAG: triose-phosphate isomerase [Myxococcota bacterium]